MGTVDHIMNIEMPIVRTETDDNSPCPREPECRRQVAKEIFEELENKYFYLTDILSGYILIQRGDWDNFKARWLK